MCSSIFGWYCLSGFVILAEFCDPLIKERRSPFEFLTCELAFSQSPILSLSFLCCLVTCIFIRECVMVLWSQIGLLLFISSRNSVTCVSLSRTFSTCSSYCSLFRQNWCCFQLYNEIKRKCMLLKYNVLFYEQYCSTWHPCSFLLMTFGFPVLFYYVVYCSFEYIWEGCRLNI